MAKITFVDTNDNVIGSGTRIEAVEKNIVHRIVVIFLFNSKKQLLLQKRSPNVPSPNKWDHSAAGHVDEGEEYLTAARRELSEELNVKDVEFTEIVKYYTEYPETGGTKLLRRFHTLYRVTYDGLVNPNAREVAEVKWMDLSDIKKYLTERPDDFTRGFKIAFQKYSEIQ